MMSDLYKIVKPTIDKLLAVHAPRNKGVTLCQNRNPIVILMQLVYAIPFMLASFFNMTRGSGYLKFSALFDELEENRLDLEQLYLNGEDRFSCGNYANWSRSDELESMIW